MLVLEAEIVFKCVLVENAAFSFHCLSRMALSARLSSLVAAGAISATTSVGSLTVTGEGSLLNLDSTDVSCGENDQTYIC